MFVDFIAVVFSEDDALLRIKICIFVRPKTHQTMYVAINGIYENGTFVLNEVPPTNKKTKVVILFTDEIPTSNTLNRRVSGGLKHLGGTIPDNFNDPIDDFDDNDLRL